MVELRKRPPPKEPIAPAPAAKKGRSNKNASVADKAKAAVTKTKEAIVGSSNDAVNQPTAEDEAVVQTGEGGMIPETAGTAPSTTTAPADIPAPTEAVPPTKGRGRTKKSPTIGLVSAGPAAGEPAETPARAREPGPETNEALENPPEKGGIEPATSSSTSGPQVELSSSVSAAKLPLNADSVGKQIPSLGTFGGSNVETHHGQKITVSDLLSQASSGGIVMFTYPKASTGGCTQQVCSFRDSYNEFSDKSSYKIYGLSTDSTKANSNFATKQKLQYDLLCDKSRELVGALGMGSSGSAKRGVVVIDHQGIVKVWFQGGPQKTVDVVREYLSTLK